ncbi:MAG: tripartite tricarboxylate transporter substrate binding protein [Betaproteobacteria bacterium]|nr:tripartite tricarboxylate transporter substrate binding protein [Betaproteobacteria bacterium]
MEFKHIHRSIAAAIVIAVCPVQFATEARAQPAWRPDKAVEIIVPTAAGGTNDQMARLMQKVLQDRKLVPVPLVVMNKAGGNQTLAVVYINQHAADAHYLLYATATVFTNQLAGLTKLHYAELTPLALFLVDHSVITVRADSPMKSMRDLVDRLKADPESIAFGMVARGGPNHLALSQAMRSAGVDPRKLKTVVFKTNAESMTATVGGHIHAVVSSVSAALPQVLAGNTRLLAIAAPQRQTGAVANVPTLREQGIDANGIANWRVAFGAQGLAPAQIAYWDETLARMVTADEWKNQLAANNVAGHFLRGRDLVKYLDTEYNAARSAMADLGLVK